MTSIYENVPRFMRLFDGLKIAHGTGRGMWIKRPASAEDFAKHLQGEGPGIGIAPLRPDNTVMFAAIDLDEPDFAAAREMQSFLPGASWVEKSRSGNAHVWVFFSAPCEAWVAMGLLKEATVAAGKSRVEVFPKNHDFSKVKLGNYINLPYHGDQRPILKAKPEDVEDHWHPGLQGGAAASWVRGWEYTLDEFLDVAEDSRTDPETWRTRARWLLLSPPEQRESKAEFGKQQNLHICAQHIIETADTNPILEGHRAAVYFALAKQLTNWALVDHDEALMMMRSVNEASPDRISDHELRRILGNAERGQFTSTGCDDPLFAPYAHPDCPIANPRR
jgi:hypothetical protein